ncbi:MAG TPA: hypothetical protein VK590_09750, partial [Saprospiraceae bacterium]|nr:hypothetical protein [Saprospiraceae bacterium]
MKKILVLTILYLLIYSVQSFGQDKLLTLEETVIKQRTSLAPKKLNQLQWIKGSNQYVFVQDDKQIMIGDAVKLSEPLVNGINKVEIDKELLAFKQDTSKSFLTIKSITNDEYQFKAAKGILVIARTPRGKTHFIQDPLLPDNAENKDNKNEQSNIAYTIDNNLYIFRSDRTKSVQISKDKDINIVN